MTARTPTSAPGNSRRCRIGAPGGFTLVELLVVLLVIAIAVGVATLALRDPAASRLDEEGARLAALLEGARAEARASGLAVRFELASAGSAEPFHFVGLPPAQKMPMHWLNEGVSATIDSGTPQPARALQLGPEPLIGPQRITLALGERQLTLATDGLGPFHPLEAATP